MARHGLLAALALFCLAAAAVASGEEAAQQPAAAAPAADDGIVMDADAAPPMLHDRVTELMAQGLQPTAALLFDAPRRSAARPAYADAPAKPEPLFWGPSPAGAPPGLQRTAAAHAAEAMLPAGELEDVMAEGQQVVSKLAGAAPKAKDEASQPAAATKPAATKQAVLKLAEKSRSKLRVIGGGHSVLQSPMFSFGSELACAAKDGKAEQPVAAVCEWIVTANMPHRVAEDAFLVGHAEALCTFVHNAAQVCRDVPAQAEGASLGITGLVYQVHPRAQQPSADVSLLEAVGEAATQEPPAKPHNIILGLITTVMQGGQSEARPQKGAVQLVLGDAASSELTAPAGGNVEGRALPLFGEAGALGGLERPSSGVPEQPYTFVFRP